MKPIPDTQKPLDEERADWKRLNVWIPKELYHELRGIIRQEDKTLTSIMNHLLSEYVKAYKAK